MRENNIKFYYLALVILFVNILFDFFNFFKTDSKLTSEALFDQTIQSVVELKASTENIGESFGTAVFVCADGTLVTNAHVVTYKQLDEYYEFETIEIRFSYEDIYRPVILVKFDLDLDIAVLKLIDINCNFKPIEFADSKECKTGNSVYSVGNLNNVGISMTNGIISNPSINVDYNGKIRNVIQCDLTIADGNSGGALIDENGKLLGITTFRLKDSSGNIIYGICYCVPTNTVVEYII